jgi:hypothetical protein
MNPVKRLVSALIASCSIVAAASAVTITSNNIGVSTRGTAGLTSSVFTGTSIPTSQLLDATQGASYSRDQIDYTGSGDNVTLLNTLSQKRSGVFGNYSQVEGASLFFTVATNASYSLSGAFSSVDVTTAGYVFIQSFLRDQTTSATLYNNDQYSKNTLNESFVLGGSGGDWGNDISGSLTGSLTAGHQYAWYYYAATQAYPDADGGATATGFFRLDIGGGAPSHTVPDGSTTLAMFGLTVLSLAVGRRMTVRA